MDFIINLYNQANNTYHVNPLIFVVLYIITVPIYYYGQFIMIKVGYKYFKKERKEKKKFDIGGLITSKGFIKGLIINRFGWVAPYIYVFIFGRNLPIWVYVLILVWLSITSLLIIWKTRKQAIKESISYKIANEEELLLARKFLSKRYYEAGYLSEKEAIIPYDDEYVKNSIYFVAKILDDVVGLIRIVKNSENGIPVINDFELYDNDLKYLKSRSSKRLVEIGNLAAISDKNIGKGLYKTVIKYCIKKRLITVACIDSKLLNKLLSNYWFLRPFCKQIGKQKMYIGSITVPVRLKFNVFMLLFI